MRPAPSPDRLLYRLGAVLVFTGLLLAGVSLAAHPPVFHVADGPGALQQVARAPARWSLIHGAALAGLLALGLGVPVLHRFLAERGLARFSAVAAPAYLAGVPLWAAALVMELAALPPLARPPGALPGSVVSALWASPLLLGYVASGLQWAAVILWGVDLIRGAGVGRLAGWWAAGAGGLALAALPVAAFAVRGMAGAVLLWLTQGPAGAWLGWVGWRLAREGWGR